MQPLGPFNLLNQNKYFNGWPTLKSDPTTIVMAFAVDGDWSQSTAVTMQQKPDGDLNIAVYGTADPAKAQQQALAALSLDEDGLGWQEVGKRDDFVAGLQKDLISLNDLHSLYQGKIAEQIVGQEILSTKFNVMNELHFWVREKLNSTAEVDFITMFEGKMIPIEVKSGETVLDLGCAAGIDSFIAREAVGADGQVIGLDITPELVARATHLAETQGFTNVRFHSADIENLPLDKV